MKKLFVVIICIFSLFIFSQQAMAQPESEQTALPDLKLYINDKLTQSTIYENKSSFLPESKKDFIPLRASLEEMGYSVEWREPNLIFIKTPRGRNTCMLVGDKTIEHCVFWDDDYSFLDEPWRSHRVPMNYINVDGSIYYPLYEFPQIVDCKIYRDDNSIYLDSDAYYEENHIVYENIGREVNISAFINDIKINTPVFYNTTEIEIEGNTLGYFVELRPVFESIGAGLEYISPNTVIVTYNDSQYTFKAQAVYENGKEILFENGYEDCYIVNGKTYVGFSRIRYEIDGALKQEDDHNMCLYTADFERYDIPATLQEAYKYFDENLSEEDIEFLKNSTAEELALTHMGLGLWIRNNWIYPTGDRIAKVFTDKGITHPDNMSGYIIAGYKEYLKGQPCEIEDLIK